MATPAPTRAPSEASPIASYAFRRSHLFLLRLISVFEIAVALVCLGGALTVRHLFSLSALLPESFIFAALLIGGSIALSLATRSITAWIASPRLVASSVLFTSLVLFASLFAFRQVAGHVSRPLILILSASMLLSLTLVHYVAARRIAADRWQQLRRLIVIGNPQEADSWAEQLPRGCGWTCVAQLSDQLFDHSACETTLSHFESLVRAQPVDEVLIMASVLCPTPYSAALYQSIIGICEQIGIQVHVRAEWIENYREVAIDYLGGRPLLTFSFVASSPWMLLTKRCLDIGVASAGLVVLSPVFAGAALAVWMSSGSPVLFVQTRFGLRGRPFRLYKFRSMVVEAPELQARVEQGHGLGGPVFKIRQDPRITRAGRWIRRTSIDELPQLWNVLRGEMSLVGPRPLPTLPDQVNRYGFQSMQRLAMKPGITGLWQVSARSSLPDFHRWMELDSAYVRNWSLLLDLRILVRTIGVVLRLSGV